MEADPIPTKPHRATPARQVDQRSGAGPTLRLGRVRAAAHLRDRKLAGRIIGLEQRLAALGADDLVRPVVRVLVRRAERQGEGARVITTLRGIAKESGLSMLEAHRALQQLLEERLVKLIDEVLEIPDLEALLSSVE